MEILLGIPYRSHTSQSTIRNLKKDKHPEAWTVTTDLSLSPAELREAAHLRLSMPENNVFKRISYLSGSKRFYFKDSVPFFNLLRLFFAAIAAYDILLYILKRNEKGIQGSIEWYQANIEEYFLSNRRDL